jgi:hypothetical protein
VDASSPAHCMLRRFGADGESVQPGQNREPGAPGNGGRLGRDRSGPGLPGAGQSAPRYPEAVAREVAGIAGVDAAEAVEEERGPLSTWRRARSDPPRFLPFNRWPGSGLAQNTACRTSEAPRRGEVADHYQSGAAPPRSAGLRAGPPARRSRSPRERKRQVKLGAPRPYGGRRSPRRAGRASHTDSTTEHWRQPKLAP